MSDRPECLKDNSATVRQVGVADGTALDGRIGVTAEDVDVFGRYVRSVVGVQDGNDSGGGVHDGAHGPVWGVGDEEVDIRGGSDDGAGGVEDFGGVVSHVDGGCVGRRVEVV